LLTILMILAPASMASAIDLRSVVPNYTLAGWSRKDGLVTATISSLAEDRDGFIWIGTAAGLWVFDGVSIARWRGAGANLLPQTVVRGLISDSDGSILAALGNGRAVFVRIRGGRAEVSNGMPGYDNSAVQFLERDVDAVWMGTQHALYSLQNGSWVRLMGEGLPDAAVQSRFEDATHTLFVGTSLGIFKCEPGLHTFSPVEMFATSAKRLWENVPHSIAEGPGNQVYVTDSTRGFRTLGTNRQDEHEERGRGEILFKDRAGNLWLGTGGQGLWNLGKEWPLRIQRLNTVTGLLGEGIRAMLEDRDGNLWAGTTEGLNRLTPKTAVQLPQVSIGVSVAALSNGTMAVASSEEVFRFEKGDAMAAPSRTLVPGKSLTAMCVDESDRIWLATTRGLAVMNGHGEGKPVLTPGTERLTRVTSITSDHRGGVWLFDATEGLFHLRNNTLVHAPSELAGFHEDSIRYLFTDRDGSVWVALATGHVFTLKSDQVVASYGPAEGLLPGAISAVFQDPEGAIWIAADFGIATLVNGRFRAIDGSPTMPIRSASSLAIDKRGALWIGTESGLLELDFSQLNDTLVNSSTRLGYRRYGRAEGLPGLPAQIYPSPRVARSVDGRLWFVTGRGVAVLDPSNLPHHEPARPVHIVAADVDDKPWDYTSHETVPAGTSRLSLTYTAPNLTTPLRTRFAYILEGYDTDWIDAGTRRQAFYTKLPPGQYRFRVVARSDDDAWQDTEDVWDFAIAPRFYQTTAFKVAVLGLLVLSVWAGWRLRVLQLRRRFSVVLKERARLSREIHDTLLQGLVGVALQLDAITDPTQQHSQVDREWLVTMRKYLETYIRETRQSILALRSTKLETIDLGSAIRDSATAIINGRPIALKFDISGEQVRLGAAAESTLLRISGEAISNAVRHSCAPELQIHLDFTPPALRLTIHDTGIGFDHSPDEAGGGTHFGLSMMKERANEIGAELAIASIPGSGTTVAVTMPLHP
jgi:signal transduction histidine kinase/ligand-binding sensor domain-containing protein